MDDRAGARLSPEQQRCAHVAVNAGQRTTTWGAWLSDSVAPAPAGNERPRCLETAVGPVVGLVVGPVGLEPTLSGT